MRKFLFFAIALITSATMMAAGGDGSSRTEAIHFEWDGTNTVEANSETWYCLGLSDLSEKANDPVIALYLNNTAAEQANVKIAACAVFKLEFLGQKVEQEFTIDPKTYLIEGKGHDIWQLPTSFDLSEQIGDNKLLQKVFDDPTHVSLLELCSYGIQIYLQVQSDKQIDILTSVYEKEEIIEDACTNSVDFNWAGETVNPGEKWFYLNLAEVKASNEKLNFVVKNAGATDANVAFDLYLNCPASAIALDYDWTIAAGSEKKESLGRFLLNQIASDYVYLKLTTDQEISLMVEKEVLPPPTPADDLFDATGASVLGNKLSLNNESKIVKVILDSLMAPKGYKTVCEVSNIGATEATLKQEIAFEPQATIHNSEVKNFTVAAETKVEIIISNKTLSNIKSEVAYFRLSTTGTMNISFKKVLVDAPAPEPVVIAPACDESYLFDWNSTIKHEAFKTKWYELDIAPIKQNKEQVQISFTNSTDSMMIAIGSILLDCNSKDTISYVLPIPGGKTINKVLDYSLFAASPLDHAYISVLLVPTAITSLEDVKSIKTREDAMDLVSTNLDAEIELTATRASALVDPTLCQTTHQTLEKGKLYTQDAGTTKWYRITDEFMMNELQLLSTITLETYGDKPANVTLGATIGCNYGIATKFSVNVPKWVDLTTLYPAAFFNAVDKVVDESVKEFYVEITTDQPIAFGFGLIRPSSLGCDDAQVFNWGTGVTLTPRNPNWYKFDITELREDKQQVKLTFTNPTDSTAWVASFVTLECPFYAGIPTVFPVPAHASVDKWVDYSFFAASPMTDLYVAAITDAPLQLIAHKESAVIEKPEGCKNALTIEKGVTYTQEAGTTQWYHVPDALLDELSFFPEFTFVNNGSATAHLTMGSTVGCEYGILTKGTIKVPTWGDLTLSLPRWIGEAVDRFVNDDVTEFYVELTTDQPIMFGIDIAYGNMFGCDNAREFDWNTGVTVTPRDAQWHKFDITELKANEMQAKLTFTNTADSIAWVAAFLTYECPFKAGLPMVFPVPAGASVDKWIDYSFIASAPFDAMYLAVYTDSHIRIDAMQETAKVTPATDCTLATVVEPNVLYTIQPGTSWYKFSADPFINTVDTHARFSFANKSGKTAHVTTGATVGCEYGILTRGKLPIPAMDTVDVNVPIWAIGLMRQFISKDVHEYFVQVTTDEALNFKIEMEMPELDPVLVYDTTQVTEYVCQGEEYVHPVSGTPIEMQNDTMFTYIADSIVTTDTIFYSVVEYTFAMVVFEPITEQILDSLDAKPVLTPGYLPKVDASIDAIKKYYADKDSETIADISEVSWSKADVVVDCDEKKRMMVLTIKAECENVFNLPLQIEVTPDTVTKKDTIVACVSYTWDVNGQSYTTTGVHKYTEPSTITGCDSVYHELHLTILPDVQNLPVEKKTICYGESYPWNGQDCNESKTYTHVVKNSLGCDSLIHTLELTVLPDVVTLPAEEKTICHGESYPWNGQDCNESKTYTHVVKNSLGCDSLIYTLELTVMAAVELPATANVQERILALCGKTANVAEAEAYVKAHVEAVELAPAIESIVWEQKVDGQWVSLQPTDGTDATVVVRYTLNTACEDVTSEEMTITVEKPTYENDPELDNIVPIYSKYGNRLLTVDLVYIKENHDWDVVADDVTWYNGDQVVGTGFYLTKEDGTPLPVGKYYARIDHTRSNPEACDGTIQTQSVTVEEANKAPKLMPTVARPQELIKVLNLNADAVSTISIYSTTGDLISTFQVANQEETTFPAAELTGYYVVNVQTETEKVSLRYVVK